MRLLWSQESRHLPEPTQLQLCILPLVYCSPDSVQASFMETGKSGVSKDSLPSDSITAAGVSEHLSTCKGTISKTE